ncbi:MAG: exo-alpha-sialidase [Planctomycetes bacterium]|nr:exo-alpha-sialidase [Planctomycetota bacterium]
MRQVLLGLLVTFPTLASAQVAPRPSQLVDLNTTFSAGQPCVGTDADRTVVGFVDNDPFAPRNAVCIVTSDGRGKTWSAPLRVDSGPDGTSRVTQYDSVQVVGDDVFVVWRDDRSTTLNRWDLYFNKSSDGGATFAGERRLDTAYPVDAGSVRDWRFLVVNANDLYVFFAVENPSGQIEAHLTASHDGGSTWSSPVRVDSMQVAANRDVECVALDVEPASPLVVHLAWIDNRNGNGSLVDVFYRRSDDGGLTLAAPDLQLDGSGAGFGDARDFVELAVLPATQLVGVAWLENGLVDGDDQLQFALSNDGGATFGVDVTVGGGTIGTDDVDWIALDAYGPNFYAAWNDDSSGSDVLYVAQAPLGTAWSSATPVSSGAALAPRFAGDPAGTVVGVVFESTVGAPHGPEAAFTTDFGVTWRDRLAYGDQPGNDADFVNVAFNAYYRNFVSAWLSDTGSAAGANRNRVWVGGFRPQTCLAVGWDDIYDPASQVLEFGLTGFGSDTVAIVGLSLGSGPVVSTGDGRKWDIGPTIAPFGGFGFVAPLTGGDGLTTTLPNLFLGGSPVGFTVRFGAVSFRPGPGIGHLTDVFTFGL